VTPLAIDFGPGDPTSVTSKMPPRWRHRSDDTRQFKLTLRAVLRAFRGEALQAPRAATAARQS